MVLTLQDQHAACSAGPGLHLCGAVLSLNSVPTARSTPRPASGQQEIVLSSGQE